MNDCVEKLVVNDLLVVADFCEMAVCLCGFLYSDGCCSVFCNNHDFAIKPNWKVKWPSSLLPSYTGTATAIKSNWKVKWPSSLLPSYTGTATAIKPNWKVKWPVFCPATPVLLLSAVSFILFF
ncbi:hypothetical protein L5515_017600 [Caenorhabditis briggsae]|uniref:Uncharacterized protein n=1 Tax=Caenorhabditis briggsae TaxID=6238 RepID=A0AAE9FH99_CAEBR|nr:hypothetical protein L5515_017600 [Caenorhabditis briggsae]